jgi:hypothetical protein
VDCCTNFDTCRLGRWRERRKVSEEGDRGGGREHASIIIALFQNQVGSPNIGKVVAIITS